MSRLFICYRRNSAFAVGRIHDDVSAVFGEESVFRDVDGIRPGTPYKQVIREEIGRADAVLVVIDETWVDSKDKRGRRKLDLPDDPVRLEIEDALRRGISIFPILLESAEMPTEDELPSSLQAICEYNATRLRDGRTYRSEMRLLTKSIQAEIDAWRGLSAQLSALEDDWTRGNWKRAHADLQAALPSCSPETNAIRYERLTKRLELLARLVDAEQHLSRKDFVGAKTILSNLSVQDAPLNVDAAIWAAEVGTQISSAGWRGSDEEDRKIRERVSQFRAEGADDMPFPGLSELEEVLDTVEQERALSELSAPLLSGRFESALVRLGTMREGPITALLTQLSELGLQFYDDLARLDWSGARATLDGMRQIERETGLGWLEPLERFHKRWRIWCTQLRSVGPAASDLTRGHGVPARFMPWGDGACPYEVLGVPTDISPRETNELQYDLVEKSPSKRMSEEERAAWDALRLPERRLRADFCLYHIADPERAEDVLAEVVGIREVADPFVLLDPSIPAEPELPPVGALRQGIEQRLGEDAGVFLARAGRLESAVEFFLDRLRGAPDDAVALHHLALAAGELLFRPEPGGDSDHGEAVDLLAMGLAGVLASDGFWRRWWKQRNQVYEINWQRVQDLRIETESYWLNKLGQLESTYPRAELRFRIELDGARALQAGGGLPVDANIRCVLGPIGIRTLGLNEALGQWATGFDEDSLEGEGWQARVCQAFSSLAEPAARVQAGAFSEALNALEATSDRKPGSFADQNPALGALSRGDRVLRLMRARLRHDAHLKLALAAVSGSPVDVECALEHWRSSVAEVEDTKERDALHRQIRDLVLGRAAHLTDPSRAASGAHEDVLADLNTAIELLQPIQAEGWDDEEQTVQQAYISALLDRAVFMSNAFDDERAARSDARLAWALSPTSLRAITVCATASAYFARELYFQGKRDAAGEVLKEIDELIESGKQLFEGHADLERCVKLAEQVRDLLSGREFDGVLTGLAPASSDGGSPRPTSPLAEALLKEAQGEHAEAIAIYDRLIEQEPESLELRSKMAYCYRSRILALMKQGAPIEEVKRVSREAVQRCPNAAALHDVPPSLLEDEEDAPPIGPEENDR